MSNRSDSGRDLSLPYASRLDLILSILVGCALLFIVAALSPYVPFSPWFLAFFACVLYMAFETVLSAVRIRHRKVAVRSDLMSVLCEESSEVLKNTATPAVIFDSYATLLWHNNAAAILFDKDVNPISQNLSDLFGIRRTGANEFDTDMLTVGGRRYRTEAFCLSKAGGGLYAMTFTDETAKEEMQTKYENERVAVAYITIDSMEDVLQSVHDTFRHAIVSVDECLKTWCASMHGVIKSYDSDKYVLFAERSYFMECIRNRFSILDDIRNTRIGDSMSVTVSIGVCAVGETLADREAGAKEAVDLALQRGGDQAVVKSESGVEYYGGRTKSVFKRSNVRSRTFASELTALMARADNVIVMGHRFGDFDSFGSSVGLARLALSCGVKVNIAVDMRDRNLLPMIHFMQDVPEFSHMFVDSAEGLDLVHPDTLLVLCDVNTGARAQFSGIAEKVNRMAVVDHHRKIDIESEQVVLSYIDPSASSACELVTEMLECTTVSRNLTKEEADMLLSGILLDTKQFTRNTGTRTFSAAQLLRGAGANPSDAYAFFKTDPADLSKEARFLTGITVYRENIAISCCDAEADESYRVIASKAADKMLTLKNVEASFTLVRIGDHIHISGRSSGKINVQLILEQLHGGGHFDVAGAQVAASSPYAVLEQLKAAIDKYIDELAAKAYIAEKV